MKRVRLSSNRGEAPPKKTSGYASGGPDKVVAGTRPGKIPGKGYSGPGPAVRPQFER